MKVKLPKLHLLLTLVICFFVLVGINLTFSIIQNKASIKQPNKERGLKTFNSDSIELTYPEELLNFNYEIFDTAMDDYKDTEIITLSTKNNINTRLIIALNQDGQGGGCPGFPTGYEISPIMVDGREVFKAKYIDEKDKYNLNWTTGNVYIVQKIDGQLTCPNSAGLQSKKNGSVTIKYLLGAGVMDPTLYSNTERLFDEVVSSLKGLWE